MRRALVILNVFFTELKSISGHFSNQFIVFWMNAGGIQRILYVIVSTAVFDSPQVKVIGNAKGACGIEEDLHSQKVAFDELLQFMRFLPYNNAYL